VKKKSNTKTDTKTKLEILIARIEVAGQSFMTYKSLRHINSCHVTQLIYSESPYSYGYDKNLGLKKDSKKNRNLLKLSNIIKIIHFMIHEFMKYDVYHFHFGISMLPLNLDIFFLKLIRSKKVFVEFHGSDIRANLTGSILNKIKTLLRRFRNNILMNVSNGIIVHDYELLNYIPKRHLIKTLILPLRIDTDNYIESKSNGVKRISHTPSNRAGKGTSIIQNIINELPLTNLKYDFKIYDNLTQSEINSILRETHILIDQIIT